MKKSEAIRLAVDRYLSPVFGENTYQLCNCVQRLYQAGDLPAHEATRIKDKITYFLGNITMTGAHEQHYSNYEEYKTTAQDLRFMFAEFLALMWEDEEDEEDEEAENE